jgi:hypothetical protein
LILLPLLTVIVGGSSAWIAPPKADKIGIATAPRRAMVDRDLRVRCQILRAEGAIILPSCPEVKIHLAGIRIILLS